MIEELVRRRSLYLQRYQDRASGGRLKQYVNPCQNTPAIKMFVSKPRPHRTSLIVENLVDELLSFFFAERMPIQASFARNRLDPRPISLDCSFEPCRRRNEPPQGFSPSPG